MDNKEKNSDKDRMLEEILGQFNNKNNSVKTVSDIKRNDKGQYRSEPTGRVYSTDNNNRANTEKLPKTGHVNTRSIKTDTSNTENIYNTAKKDKPSLYNSKDGTKTVRQVYTENPEDNKQGRESNPRKRKKKRAVRLQVVLILTVIIFTIAICLSVMIISVGKDMLAIGKEESYKIVTIPEGADVNEISQILYDEGIIKIPKAFAIVAKMGDYGTQFKPGDFELSPSFAYETIITKLTTDEYEESETVDVTFIEGVDLYTAAKQLEEAGVCDADRFIYYFNAGGYDCKFESSLPESFSSKFYRMEGYLFPDTYTFYVDMEPELVCRKIYKNFDNKITAELYTQMKNAGLTLDETITLASIVQAEAGDTDSMKKIASVFLNRLNNQEEFPKLESDPTGKYVNEVIKPNIEIQSDAIFDSYDTYICNGIPSGAIGNPGMDAILAVLNPADTDYYFFYANLDTKETFFAETLEEHEENERMVKEQREMANNENNEEDEDY